MKSLLLQAEQELSALHIACRDGRADMADLIIEAARKQTFIFHSRKYVKYEPDMQELLNMEGPEVSV